jgi:hypothetical protein
MVLSFEWAYLLECRKTQGYRSRPTELVAKYLLDKKGGANSSVIGN